MATELESEIQSNAEGPSQVSGDGQSVKTHAIKDQIEADRYLAANAAVRGRRRGIQLTTLRPPGAA